MRRIRYIVASSLDGYIADPNGGYDWITMDPEIDFGKIYEQFDTLLMGRLTFESMERADGLPLPDMKIYVVSRTLKQSDYPKATILADRIEETVTALRNTPGKDIWLFGGGQLFRTLLEACLVDTVEVAIIPILLGEGIPLLPPPAKRQSLTLTGHKVYGTGIVSLEYALK